MLILQITPDSAASLAPHRTRPGWGVCREGDVLWLRCPLDALEATAALPCAGRYRLDDQGRLIPWQGTLPVGRVPAGPWQPLQEFLTVESLPPLLPGRHRDKPGIPLERSSHEVPPGALLCRLTDLAAWAERASRLRLARLKFAASQDGRILVTGLPLPPLAGISCYFEKCLILPCGWQFAPPVLPAWVEQALALPPGGLALIHPQGRMEVIGQEGLTPLTLSALRRTMASLTLME